MSLYFICGKIGSGKSYVAMTKIVRELVSGNRQIVTNLPIFYDVFDQYLQRKYPEKEIQLLSHSNGELIVESRIRVLQETELREFYRFRHITASPVEKIPRDVQHPVNLLDLSPWCRGGTHAGCSVVYFLDELQLFYNCRKFADAPDEFAFYLSQHRKLGDDIYVMTQSPQNVDKMFRSFTQEYIFCTNVSKIKIHGLRLPRIFKTSGYQELPTGNFATASYTSVFRMDFELADCYDTASGLGIEAVAADKHEKPSGLPWWIALIGFPVVLICVVLLFEGGLRRALGVGVEHGNRVVHEAISSNLPSSRSSSVPMDHPFRDTHLPAGNSLVVGGRRDKTFDDLPIEISQDVYMTGQSYQGGRSVVYLSDGRVFDSRLNPELRESNDRYCIISGVLYRFASLEKRLELEQKSVLNSRYQKK